MRPISADVMRIFVLIVFTRGLPSQPSQHNEFLISQMYVRDANGWHVASIMRIANARLKRSWRLVAAFAELGPVDVVLAGDRSNHGLTEREQHRGERCCSGLRPLPFGRSQTRDPAKAAGRFPCRAREARHNRAVCASCCVRAWQTHRHDAGPGNRGRSRQSTE
jgi:hypothetical protein